MRPQEGAPQIRSVVLESPCPYRSGDPDRLIHAIMKEEAISSREDKDAVKSTLKTE